MKIKNKLDTDNGSITFSISNEIVSIDENSSILLISNSRNESKSIELKNYTNNSNFYVYMLNRDDYNYNRYEETMYYYYNKYDQHHGYGEFLDYLNYRDYCGDYWKYYRRSDYRTLLLIKDSNNKKIKSDFICVEKAAANLLESSSKTISCLVESIEKVFALDNLSYLELYDFNDIKNQKGDGLAAKVNYIDQNVKLFLKNNRIYAALAFIKEQILPFQYGFSTKVHFTPPIEHPETIDVPNYISQKGYYEVETFKKAGRQILKFDRQKTQVEVVYHLSHIVWIYYKQKNNYVAETIIDHNGIILNKIVEYLFKLIIKTGHSEPIVEIYKTLSKLNIINLKSDTLVSIIESLLKFNEKQLIEIAILELKKIEPLQPIIEIANKSLRRIQVLNKISETFNINIFDIQKLNGIEFEMFLENQFVKCGFKVERTKGSGDFGADLIIETASGTRASIQAKRYKQKANLKAVQEVVASLAHYQTDFGIVITTSGFFQSAVDLAQTNNVELWDEDKLIQFLSGDLQFSMLGE